MTMHLCFDLLLLCAPCMVRSSQQRPRQHSISYLPVPPCPQVRCAGAVWLVSLLLYCGRHPRLLPLLPDVQQALSSLLGDQNELTQVGLGWRGAGNVSVAVCPLKCLLTQSAFLLGRFPAPHPMLFPPHRRWQAVGWLLCTTWLVRAPARPCSTP